jgi:hypothetical protein
MDENDLPERDSASPGRKKRRRARKPPAYKVRFGNVSPEEAAQGRKITSERVKSTLSSRRLVSDIQTKELWLTGAQKEALDALCSANEIVDHTFYINHENARQSQLNAAALMASYGLDLDSREVPANRWSVRSSQERGPGQTKRVLYQWCVQLSVQQDDDHRRLNMLSKSSDCGYDHREVGTAKRQTVVDFTGCLAHAEITFIVETQQILRLRGFFGHNNACKDAVLLRIPPLPLHPYVYQVALAQLADGISLTDIQEKNRVWVKSGGDGNIPKNGRDWKHRYVLQRHDTRSLYRQFSRLNGVKVTESPQNNIHEWLDPKSPQYDKSLADAVFHYSARVEKGDRFEVCVATNEMKEASWKYGYCSQIILDGTFGVCDKRLLLFIVMGVDENKRGVPLAFLFFSAPSGNQQSSAGYDTDIIEKLLRVWKKSLEDFRGGKPFYALVAITDTDLKERKALIRVTYSRHQRLRRCPLHVQTRHTTHQHNASTQRVNTTRLAY